MKLQLSLLLVLALYFPALVFAQFSCGFDEVHTKRLKSDSAYQKRVVEIEEIIKVHVKEKQKELNISEAPSATALYTIPVVVHVIHTGDAVGTIYNPSDAQIQSTIDYLNQIYNGSYTGTQGVGDIQIQFQLAVRDPNCNPTSGIVRVDGTGILNYVSSGVNAATTGGANEIQVKNISRWSNSDYYNIWVVNKIDGSDGTSGSYVGGYAYFPGGDPAYDGTIILATQMGVGKKTLPHELGHAFALYHPFRGSSGSTCLNEVDCGTEGDFVCDTDPITQPSGFVCRTGTNSCTTTPYNSNTEYNYMNYTNCYNLFTAGQKSRMLAVAASIYRRSLSTSLALEPTNIVSTYTSPIAPACAPATASAGMNMSAAGILNVQIHNKNYYSSIPPYDGGYVDATTQCIKLSELVQGSTYTIAVTVLAANYHQVRAWIDFNNDGSFDNSSEQVLFASVFNAASTPTVAANFTVPSNAAANTPLRFRIIDDLIGYSGTTTITSACHAPYYGQAEDYAVYMQEAITLPASLKSFSAKLNEGYIQLRWQMSSENSNREFEVEKSTDGKSFRKIGVVNAHMGGSWEYQFKDVDIAEKNFYRLRMVGNDQGFDYSQIVAVANEAIGSAGFIVSNPFNNHIDLKTNTNTKSLKLQLLNASGNLVAERMFYRPAGTVRWDLPGQFVNGFYVLKIVTDDASFSRKLIKR